MRPLTAPPRGATQFKAYDGTELRLHTWAFGAAIEMEKAVFQTRLNRGDFTHVDVIELATKTTTMIRRS